MAQRRMISKEIFDSDTFNSLPVLARLLWISYVIHADDDGIVNNPLLICRNIGASKGDLEQLLQSKLIIIAPNYEGTNIVVIVNWIGMNQVQPTKYRPSNQTEIRNALRIVNGKYQMIPISQHEVDVRSTQNSIVKDSIVEDSIVQYSIYNVVPYTDYIAIHNINPLEDRTLHDNVAYTIDQYRQISKNKTTIKRKTNKFTNKQQYDIDKIESNILSN